MSLPLPIRQFNGIKVSGNSMSPVLPDGCTVGIDTSKTQVMNGEMYAIDHHGELRVKTLFKMPNGTTRLQSFNKSDWPDEIVAPEEIRVLGKVFWYSVLVI